MSIDLAQFHQVFFEESFEGLEAMESGLLNLELGEPDVEAINTIFRAAHSIKGGAGTFGFMNVSNFTHVMETLLDEMREGKRLVTEDGVALLLEATDFLGDMLRACKGNEESDEQRAAELYSAMEAMLKGGDATARKAASPPDATPGAATVQAAGWQIHFAPKPHLLRTGNDVLRMFRELRELGNLTVVANADALPDLLNFQPEDVYLSWDLTLDGNASEDQVREIFSWVEDDCELQLTELIPEQPTVAVPVETVEANTPVSEGQRTGTDRRQGDRRQGDRRQGDRRAGGSAGRAQSTSIRVDIDKVDSLINLVGELVIIQSMLSQFGNGGEFDQSRYEDMQAGLEQLERSTREMQEAVMSIRMMPISFAFSRFPRLVHDLSAKMGKHVELKLSGETTELDKTVMEKIGDPLVHLVRNSLDHGLETPEVRIAAGKDPVGTLGLNAFHEGGNIVIQISDDGAGLNTEKILSKAREKGLLGAEDRPSDQEIHRLIFAPGFSTADQVSDVSGRGVGMDVVMSNIKELGGRVDVNTVSGQGSVFTIRLPLTLAILDGQLARVGGQTLILPLASIIESLQLKPKEVNHVGGKGEVYKLRDEYVPIIRVASIFNIPNAKHDLGDGLLVVAEAEGEKVGLFVDELLGQQQVVIKSLAANYRKVDGVSGATILGDGDVALILDIPGMVNLNQFAGEPAAAA